MSEFDSMLLLALAIRMFATASVVIAVTCAVERLGPLIGGALAGLPVVIGPGLYFLSLDASTQFVTDAASHALWSLCGTQAFIITYMAVASRHGVAASILCAGAVWAVAAVISRFMPPEPIVATALFSLATYAAWRFGARLAGETQPGRSEGGLAMLLLRGCLAGLLVAAVTAISSRVGPQFSGIFLAFPIGFGVLAVTLHERLGARRTISTLNGALRGAIGLAVFCAASAYLLGYMPPPAALGLAACISCIFTAMLVIRARFASAG